MFLGGPLQVLELFYQKDKISWRNFKYFPGEFINNNPLCLLIKTHTHAQLIIVYLDLFKINFKEHGKQ